jgi:superoxide dismutase
MSTVLTTPVATPSITDQNIRRFELDLDSNQFSYTIFDVDSNGNGTTTHTEFFTVLNPNGTAHSDINAIKASLKDILSKALTDARNKSLIGSGTDTEDIP